MSSTPRIQLQNQRRSRGCSAMLKQNLKLRYCKTVLQFISTNLNLEVLRNESPSLNQTRKQTPKRIWSTRFDEHRAKIRRRLFVCVKERISNVSRTYSRLCWRKRQRFVIVSPWCTLVHLAVSVNMITGIKHPQPRHPRELQLTAERHGVIS